MCVQPILPPTASIAAAKRIFHSINYSLWYCDDSLEAQTAVGSHSCDCPGPQAIPGKPPAASPRRSPPTQTAPAASTRRCWRSPPPGCSFPSSRSRGGQGGQGGQGGMGGRAVPPCAGGSRG